MNKNELLKIVRQIYIFFVKQKGKPIYLICNESVSMNKQYNLKRHYEMKNTKTTTNINPLNPQKIKTQKIES